MKRIVFLLVEVVALVGVFAATAPTSQPEDGEGSTIYGVKIPPGYRDWKMIAVDNLLVAGKADQLRAQLGNDIAINAFKEGKLPFPDGSIIAAIHWTRVPSEDNNKGRTRREGEMQMHTPGPVDPDSFLEPHFAWKVSLRDVGGDCRAPLVPGMPRIPLAYVRGSEPVIAWDAASDIR